MAEEKEKPIDQQIKEAELAKLKAETADIAKHSKQARIMGVPIVQVIFGGIVVGFVLLNYIQPLVNLNTENSNLVTDISTKEKDYNEIKDRLERIKLKALSKDLQQLADSLQTERAKLVASNETLTQETKDLENRRKKAEANLANVQSRVAVLNAQEQKLKASLESAGIREIIKDASQDWMITTDELYAIHLKQYQMIMAKDYYDAGLNPKGKGIDNQFQPQPGDSVIFDAATGLTWQQSGSKRMLYSKTEKYIQQINAQAYGGEKDWRLPTLEEAMSLMEPAANKAYCHFDSMFDCMQDKIWTAEMISVGQAWGVDFKGGRCRHTLSEQEYYNVRAVRRKGPRLNVSK